MTDPVNAEDDLEALALRCERAAAPDRNLDSDIMRALGMSDLQADYAPTPFTASLDAAMTLVPDGYHPNQSGGDPSASDGGRFYVEMDPNNDSPDERRLQRGSGQTFALALCAAALRARATQPPSGAAHAALTGEQKACGAPGCDTITENLEHYE